MIIILRQSELTVFVTPRADRFLPVPLQLVPENFLRDSHILKKHFKTNVDT